MISIGSDHGGLELKNAVIKHLGESNIEVQDKGPYTTESVNYAPYAKAVADDVVSGKAKFGILICTTGIGICMAANKVKGIRAATCSNEYTAKMTRLHNNANILCMGQNVVDEETALKMVDIFLSTEFEGGRHQTRIDEIKMIEDGEL